MCLATHDRSIDAPERVATRSTVLIADAGHAGEAIARCLARRDFAVVLGHAPRDADTAARAVAAIRRSGGHAIAVPGDDVRALLDRAEEVFGHVDVLIDNGRGELPSRNAEDRLFDRYFGAALRGMTDSVREAAPRLRSGGCIVHLSDARSDDPRRTLAWITPQAALEWLLRTFAAELARYAIRVNAIAPSSACDDTEVAEAVALLLVADGDACNGTLFGVAADACRAIGVDT